MENDSLTSVTPCQKNTSNDNNNLPWTNVGQIAAEKQTEPGSNQDSVTASLAPLQKNATASPAPLQKNATAGPAPLQKNAVAGKKPTVAHIAVLQESEKLGVQIWAHCAALQTFTRNPDPSQHIQFAKTQCHKIRDLNELLATLRYHPFSKQYLGLFINYVTLQIYRRFSFRWPFKL